MPCSQPHQNNRHVLIKCSYISDYLFRMVFLQICPPHKSPQHNEKLQGRRIVWSSGVDQLHKAASDYAVHSFLCNAPSRNVGMQQDIPFLKVENIPPSLQLIRRVNFMWDFHSHTDISWEQSQSHTRMIVRHYSSITAHRIQA